MGIDTLTLRKDTCVIEDKVELASFIYDVLETGKFFTTEVALVENQLIL